MITVSNKGTNPNVEAAVNQWGKDGDTHYFPIGIGKSETWNRGDDRGFVLAVQIVPNRKSYLVVSNSTVEIYDTEISIDGKRQPF